MTTTVTPIRPTVHQSPLGVVSAMLTALVRHLDRIQETIWHGQQLQAMLITSTDPGWTAAYEPPQGRDLCDGAIIFTCSNADEGERFAAVLNAVGLSNQFNIKMRAVAYRHGFVVEVHLLGPADEQDKQHVPNEQLAA